MRDSDTQEKQEREIKRKKKRERTEQHLRETKKKDREERKGGEERREEKRRRREERKGGEERREINQTIYFDLCLFPQCQHSEQIACEEQTTKSMSDRHHTKTSKHFIQHPTPPPPPPQAIEGHPNDHFRVNVFSLPKLSSVKPVLNKQGDLIKSTRKPIVRV